MNTPKRNQKLKAKIVERYDTQSAFSEAVNVHPSHVSEVVSGKRLLDLTEQLRWAFVLDCTIEDLWGES